MPWAILSRGFCSSAPASYYLVVLPIFVEFKNQTLLEAFAVLYAQHMQMACWQAGAKLGPMLSQAQIYKGTGSGTVVIVNTPQAEGLLNFFFLSVY